MSFPYAKKAYAGGSGVPYVAWEFLSRPGKPHPLFRGLIEAAQQRRSAVVHNGETGQNGQQKQAAAAPQPMPVQA